MLDSSKRACALVFVSAISAVLISACPSVASIVFTPANVTIENSTYNLDIDNDGMTDFSFNEQNKQQSPPCDPSRGDDYFSGLSVEGYPNNAVLGASWPLALHKGYMISGGPFERILGQLEIGVYGPLEVRGQCIFANAQQGNWRSGTAFLGVDFVIPGQGSQFHYGWVELNVRCLRNCGSVVATVLGYAYETIPEKPIIAGRR